MSLKASDVVNVALKYRGVKANPPGSSNVIFNTRYYGYPVYDADAYPWCVTFLWAIFDEAGASSLFYGGGKTASCSSLFGYYKNKGQTVDKTKGQTGDIIFMNFSGGTSTEHAGIVVSRNSDGSYSTVEGNTSDPSGSQDNGGIVYQKTRYLQNIVGLARPQYSDIGQVVIPPYNPGGSGGSMGGGGNFGQNNYTPYDTGSKLKYIKDAQTNHKIGNIQNLKNKIELVNQYVSKHDVQAFIEFSVNGVSFNSRDADSFKHYAISLENQKTGVGQGNKFKITIAFHKHFSNYGNINQFEVALGPLRDASLMNYSGSGIMQKIKSDARKNICRFRYGYNTNDNTLITEEQVGLLLKYSVKANKQIVEYTLEGYAGENAKIGTVNWYPNIEGMSTVTLSNGTQVKRANINLKTANSGLTESDMALMIQKLNEQYSGGITFNPYFALDCFLQDYNNSSDADSQKYYLIDCTDNQNKLSDVETLEPVRMSLCRGQTPLQYIEYCISLFKYKTKTNYALQYMKQQQQTTERFVYRLVTDKDDPYKTYICVDCIDSSELNESKTAYEFIGYTPDNRLLIDYNLDYDGTIALAIADNFGDDNTDSNTAIYIDKDGALRAKASVTRDMFVAGEIDDVLISKQNTWLDKVSCANSCTMQTFGLPFEISIGTIFKCSLYITDTPHHSSGYCFVTGVTDRIQNSMFTTDFTMIRLPGRYTGLRD